MNEIAIHRIEPFRIWDIAGSIGRIYRDAYDYPIDDADSFINGPFARHVRWPGFLLLLATLADEPVGFVYGYQSRPGQWWHDTIAPAMREAEQTAWLKDAFELAEIAVAPAMQGQGVGSTLIGAFLHSVPPGPVLLSADMNDHNRARELYRRFGFIDIIPGFSYPGFSEQVVIMGRKPER